MSAVGMDPEPVDHAFPVVRQVDPSEVPRAIAFVVGISAEQVCAPGSAGLLPDGLAEVLAHRSG